MNKFLFNEFFKTRDERNSIFIALLVLVFFGWMMNYLGAFGSMSMNSENPLALFNKGSDESATVIKNVTTEANGGIVDINGNGIPDSEEANGGIVDINGNGIPDSEEANGGIVDVNGNDIPDSEEDMLDANENGIPDSEEANGGIVDINGNGIPDSEEKVKGIVDANGNGIPDSEETNKGIVDANGNGIPDSEETDKGIVDINGNGIPDSEEKAKGIVDANGNGISDWKETVKSIEDAEEKAKIAAAKAKADAEIAANLAGTEKGVVDANGNVIPDAEEKAEADEAAKAKAAALASAKAAEEKAKEANNVDTDSDGVIDSEDKCPDLKGDKKNNGCPPDSDGDGVYDSEDKCPNKAGIKTNNGCPEVKIEAEEKEALKLAVTAVEFRSGSARIKTSSYPALKDILKILKKYPTYKLRIGGHTDNEANAAYNLKLSKSRAKSCFEYFTARGISAKRLKYNGFGETKPVTTNETFKGKKQNRRVEFDLFE